MLRSVCLGHWRHITVRLFFDAASQTTFFIPFQWQKSIFLVKFAYGWKSIFSNCNVHFRPFSRNERQRKKNSFCLYIYMWTSIKQAICIRCVCRWVNFLATCITIYDCRNMTFILCFYFPFKCIDIWIPLSLSLCLPLFLPCQCSWIEYTNKKIIFFSESQ